MVTFILMPTFAISALLVGGEYTFLFLSCSHLPSRSSAKWDLSRNANPGTLSQSEDPMVLLFDRQTRPATFIRALLMSSDRSLPTAHNLILSPPRCVCRTPVDQPA